MASGVNGAGAFWARGVRSESCRIFTMKGVVCGILEVIDVGGSEGSDSRNCRHHDNWFIVG
jgi:hypothetical protein